MYSLSHQLATQQLRDIGSDSRLIAVHPSYIQQHLIFTELLHEEDFVYIRLAGTDLTRSELEQQLVQALEHQTGASRLNGLQYLVLDDCDCASPTEFGAFVADLLSQMDGGKLVLMMREIPQSLLGDTALLEEAVFLPSDRSLMLWDYSRPEVSQSTLLEVRALGTGRVLLNGERVDSWDGVLPRSLFFYLVDRGMTTRNDIFETFWPNLSVREATNVFHVTKRKISEVLGVDLTTYWSGFYRISPDIELSYDVVQFSELLQSSVVQATGQATETLRRAIWLYRDDFLTSFEMEWVENRRHELRQSYSEALIGLAKAVDEPGALGYYLRALNINPQREDVAHRVMLLYQDMGQPEDALRVFLRLKDELERNLGVSPARYLQELAHEIEQGGAAPTGVR